MTDYANGSTPRILLRAYLTSDHVSDATGKTIAVTISKNGGAFGNPAAGATNATEIASGWYYVDLGAGDTGTNGPLIVRGTAAATDTAECCHDVVPATNGRLSSLPATACTTNASLLTSGAGSDQLSVASGRAKADTVYWNAAAVSVPTNAGVPNVNAKTWNDLATVDLPLVPTTAGRKLDVSAGGEAGVDWANVGSPTTSLALTGTTIATTQKVDIETIKTNPVVNAGTITFPTTATLASTANITAGTITTVTNLTNAPTSGDFTSTMKTSLNSATPASVVGAVGSVTGLTASDVAAIKAKTDSLTYTVAGQVDANIQYVNDVQVTGNGQSGTEWGP